MSKLKHVIELLKSGEKLDKVYLDHKLKGKYNGARECHIEPDWILIYYVMDDELILRLSRTGSHAKLFLLLF